MGRFVSNRIDVEAGIKQGNWIVAFSARELTETDLATGIVATGVSIYTGSPELVFAWIDELISESIAGLESGIASTFTAEARSQAENFAIPIIKSLLQNASPGESQETFGHFGIKAGLAKFIGHNEEWNIIAHPGNIGDAIGALFGGGGGGSDVGEWQQYGPGLVS
jgi:hypothetical protein